MEIYKTGEQSAANKCTTYVATICLLWELRAAGKKKMLNLAVVGCVTISKCCSWFVSTVKGKKGDAVMLKAPSHRLPARRSWIPADWFR